MSENGHAGDRVELSGERRLSCSLITWGNAFEQGLTEVADLGFRAVEPPWRWARAWEDDPSGFVKTLAQRGLRASAMYGTSELFGDGDVAGAVAEYVRVGRFLSEISVDTMVLGPAMTPRSPQPLDGARLERGASVLDQAARQIAQLGVRCCLHPHLWSELEREDDIEGVLERTDPHVVGICVDTAHLAGAGIDLADFIRRHGSRCWHVHLKDLRRGGERRYRPKDAPAGSLLPFCELGQGEIDWDGVLSALGDIGYRGWLVVEIDHTTLRPAESIEQCRDWLRAHYGISTSDGFETVSKVSRKVPG